MLGRNLLVWKAAIGALSVAASCGVAAARGFGHASGEPAGDGNH